MSREYSINNTLLMWDFILHGTSLLDHTKLMQQEDLLLNEPTLDPFINLEFISCAMVILIKEELMECDFSMCLGLLMSYKEPDSALSIIRKAVKIRQAILEKKRYEREPSPIP